MFEYPGSIQTPFCINLTAALLLPLQLAKQQGDFLLVGLHTDEDVEARRGPHTPIMNVHERALSVLACRYVDEVRGDVVMAVASLWQGVGLCGQCCGSLQLHIWSGQVVCVLPLLCVTAGCWVGGDVRVLCCI